MDRHTAFAVDYQKTRGTTPQLAVTAPWKIEPELPGSWSRDELLASYESGIRFVLVALLCSTAALVTFGAVYELL
jgi:hypothetical protein